MENKKSKKKLIVILGNCVAETKVLKNYFHLDRYKSIKDVTKKTLKNAEALVVKGVVALKKEEVDRFQNLKRIIKVSESLELCDIKVATMIGVEIANNPPNDSKLLTSNLISSVFTNLPLVAVLNRSDCSKELSILKDAASIAVFETQSSNIPSTMLKKAVALITFGPINLNELHLEKFQILRLIVDLGDCNIDMNAAGKRGIAVCKIANGDRRIAAEEIKMAIYDRMPYALQYWRNVHSFTYSSTTPFWHQTKIMPLYKIMVPGIFRKYRQLSKALFEGLKYDEFGKVILTPEQNTAFNAITKKSYLLFSYNLDAREKHSHLKIDYNLYFPTSFEYTSYAICDKCGLWSVGYVLTHLLIIYHIRVRHSVPANRLEIIASQCSNVDRNGIRCDRTFYVVQEHGPLPSLQCWICERFNNVNSRYFPKPSHDEPNNYMQEFEEKSVIVMKTSGGVTVAYSTYWGNALKARKKKEINESK